jgi:hypothetical protein
VVNTTLRPLYPLPPGKTRYPLHRRLGGAPGSEWTDAQYLAPHQDSIPGSSTPQRVAIQTELCRLFVHSSTIYLLVTPVRALLCVLICNLVSRELGYLLCITGHNVSSEFSLSFTGYNVLMWSAWFKYEGKNSLSGIGVGRERHKEAEICPPLLFELATETNRRLR